MTDKIEILPENFTIAQAVERCEELVKQTGKPWNFKANRGVVKLVRAN